MTNYFFFYSRNHGPFGVFGGGSVLRLVQLEHVFLFRAKIRHQEFEWSPICDATPVDARLQQRLVTNHTH